MILFLLSLIAGVLTVLAPCTLPLLPVIVGGSISNENSPKSRWVKPLVITGSLSLSIILFTFALKVSTALINIPQWVWPLISGSILIIFGLISIFPTVWEKIPFVSKLSTSSNKVLGVGYQKKNILGDILIGAALGPVFSTCSPTYFVILATVLPQSFLLGLIDLLAYTAGLSLSLLVIAFLGQKIVGKLEGVSDTHGWFKRGLGILFLILGLMIIAGYDKVLEKKILESGFFDITSVEQKLLKYQKQTTKTDTIVDQDPDQTSQDLDSLATTTANGGVANPATKYDASKITSRGQKAAEITDPSGFVNTEGKPVTISQFKHKKVVLLDIWTYSCINCQRTLPYISAWYDKYKDQGLEVIGLHTPEFAFEKVQSNVEDAVKKFGIKYPVVLDNQYATWNAYGNQFWPRKYLISANGEIVYDHTGEGDYDVTEKEIQKALKELHEATGDTSVVSDSITKPTNIVGVDSSKVGSPEVYFGYARNSFLGNGEPGVAGEKKFSFTTDLLSKPVLNKVYLEGVWDIQKDHALTKGPARILFKYSAKNVYTVLSGGGKKVTVIPYIDDVRQSPIEVTSNQLYQVVTGSSYGTHTLRIEIQEAGLEAYTFTFG